MITFTKTTDENGTTKIAVYCAECKVGFNEILHEGDDEVTLKHFLLASMRRYYCTCPVTTEEA